jgi:hypothetical protein
MSIAGGAASRTAAFIALTDIGGHRASTGITIIGGIISGGTITTADTTIITAGIVCDRLDTTRLVPRGGFFIRAIQGTIRCRKLSHPVTPPTRRNIATNRLNRSPHLAKHGDLSKLGTAG